MKVFLRILKWFILLLCLVTPMSIALAFYCEQPLSIILSAIWGLACGFIATKSVL